MRMVLFSIFISLVVAAAGAFLLFVNNTEKRLIEFEHGNATMGNMKLESTAFSQLSFSASADKKKVEKTMEGHILASAERIGLYSRK